MATDLGTTNASMFNTGNMKPESGNQTDALWGQNLSDNTAFLRWNDPWAVRPLFNLAPSCIAIGADTGAFNENG